VGSALGAADGSALGEPDGAGGADVAGAYVQPGDSPAAQAATAREAKRGRASRSRRIGEPRGEQEFGKVTRS
jgi:hypothetical protein